MGGKSIRDVDLANKTVFLRLDLNVPISEGTITDTTRIDAVLPTLGHCLKAGAKVVVASHLGRPKGEPNPALSLQPVAEKLQTLLGWPVRFCPESVGPRADEMKADLEEGDVLLLENLRFSPGETKNDPGFASGLAQGCDLYATDATPPLSRQAGHVWRLEVRRPGLGNPRVHGLGNLAPALVVRQDQHDIRRILGGNGREAHIPGLDFHFDELLGLDELRGGLLRGGEGSLGRR